MNAVYPLAAEAALTALFPDAASIVALDASYTYDDAHQFESDLTGQLGDVIALATVAFTGGILTADNPTITSLSPGDVIASFVVFNDTGTPATSAIVGFADTDSTGAVISYTSDGTPLPVTFPGLTIVSV